MICENLKYLKDNQTRCDLTSCQNPTPAFCDLACPLKHGHKPEESLNVYRARKHGIKIGQTKPVEKTKTNQQVKVVSCSDKQYVLLANYFRQLCMACENNLHCDAKNFSKCLLKSSKWKTCPRGFWTEEMWNEALEKTKETK